MMRTSMKVALVVVSIMSFTAGFVGTGTTAQTAKCPACDCGKLCGEAIRYGVVSGGGCQSVPCRSYPFGPCQTACQ